MLESCIISSPEGQSIPRARTPQRVSWLSRECRTGTSCCCRHARLVKPTDRTACVAEAVRKATKAGEQETHSTSVRNNIATVLKATVSASPPRAIITIGIAARIPDSNACTRKVACSHTATCHVLLNRARPRSNAIAHNAASFSSPTIASPTP